MHGMLVGRLGGVPLVVPPLFVFWSAFLWWSFVTVLPRSHVGFPSDTYPFLSLGATLLFVASVLTHDTLVVMAMRALGRPLPTRLILAPWGCSWEVPPDDGEPYDDRALGRDLIAALLGPTIYLAFGILFLQTSLVLARSGTDFLPTRAVTDALAAGTAMLAFLNLVPGHPLDAGRAVVAVVRKLKGDTAKAIEAATFGGKLVAFWSIAIGIYAMVGNGSFWGLWGVIFGTAVFEGLAITGITSKREC